MRSYRRGRPLQRQKRPGSDWQATASSSWRKCLQSSFRICLIPLVKSPPSLGLIVATSLLALPFSQVAGQAPEPSRSPLRLLEDRRVIASDLERPLQSGKAGSAARFYERPITRPFIEPLPPILEENFEALPIPSPTPLPSASPLPSPTVVPTPTIAPSTTPAPSISPTPPPPPPVPAFPVPPPNPAPALALPARPEPAPPSSAPSSLYLQQITPVIEVWRAGALAPELPARRGKQVGPIALPIGEVVIVRLQFGPLATGKSVVVTASGGVILDPPQQILAIQPSADCAVSFSLSDGYSNGAIRFYCEGISTTLTLSRVIPEAQPLSQRTSKGARR